MTSTFELDALLAELRPFCSVRVNGLHQEFDGLPPLSVEATVEAGNEQRVAEVLAHRERLSDEEFTARLDKDLCGRGEHWCAAEARRARYEEERLRGELARERSAWDRLQEETCRLREELERVAANRAELVEDVASAVAERDAKHAEVIRLRQDAGRLADEVQVLIQRRVLDARSPAGDALLDFREPPRSERGDRLVELEDALSAERVEAIRLRLDVEAERARTEMAEQTRDGLLEENARLRAALKGLSGEKWWPDRQSRGPCWCAYNSADWFDHAPGCKRAAEALAEEKPSEQLSKAICLWCGESHPPEDGQMVEHQECPKHPMSELERENDRLREALKPFANIASDPRIDVAHAGVVVPAEDCKRAAEVATPVGGPQSSSPGGSRPRGCCFCGMGPWSGRAPQPHPERSPFAAASAPGEPRGA